VVQENILNLYKINLFFFLFKGLNKAFISSLCVFDFFVFGLKNVLDIYLFISEVLFFSF